jgi:hypothetical protein
VQFEDSTISTASALITQEAATADPGSLTTVPAKETPYSVVDTRLCEHTVSSLLEPSKDLHTLHYNTAASDMRFTTPSQSSNIIEFFSSDDESDVSAKEHMHSPGPTESTSNMIHEVDTRSADLLFNDTACAVFWKDPLSKTCREDLGDEYSEASSSAYDTDELELPEITANDGSIDSSALTHPKVWVADLALLPSVEAVNVTQDDLLHSGGDCSEPQTIKARRIQHDYETFLARHSPIHQYYHHTAQPRHCSVYDLIQYADRDCLTSQC